MAFKMNNAPFQKETREQRKAANKAYRQSLKKERKDEKALRPYANSKTVDKLLGKLANPAKTEENHGIKKGVKAISTLAAIGAAAPKIYKKLVGPKINGVRYPASYRDE
jgi:hypothetical protein